METKYAVYEMDEKGEPTGRCDLFVATCCMGAALGAMELWHPAQFDLLGSAPAHEHCDLGHACEGADLVLAPEGFLPRNFEIYAIMYDRLIERMDRIDRGLPLRR